LTQCSQGSSTQQESFGYGSLFHDGFKEWQANGKSFEGYGIKSYNLMPSSTVLANLEGQGQKQGRQLL
jgi:hypothetical protein